MPYATVDEFLERYDVRDIGDLLADDNVQITAAQCQTNKKLLAALNDASGEIDSAVMVGERYTPTDLRNLTANSAYTLIRITCEIALARLMQRRPGRAIEQVKAMREAADASLKSLSQGNAVLETTTAGTAGQPSISTITFAEYTSLNLLRDRASGYYPPRQLPLRRQS
jgi:phage gp36-like protein